MILSGLLGRSILASRSPWLHEQEARAQKLDLSYDLFDFTDRGWDDDRLGPVLHDLAARGFSGVNVTFPFKQAVIPLLDEVAPSARAVGAVNTVAMREGRLVGHNTDMSGFAAGFRLGLPGAALGRVIQLGCGGAGAAVASALLSLGTERLDIVDIDAERASDLARKLAEQGGEGRVFAVPADALDTLGADGLVNATPIGMASLPGMPIAAEAIRPGQWVADIVYFPLETEFLRAAAAKGCRTLDGVGMVVNQAAQAFEIITGHAADAARMRESFSA